jgi:hypothetical protein
LQHGDILCGGTAARRQDRSGMRSGASAPAGGSAARSGASAPAGGSEGCLRSA